MPLYSVNTASPSGRRGNDHGGVAHVRNVVFSNVAALSVNELLSVAAVKRHSARRTDVQVS